MKPTLRNRSLDWWLDRAIDALFVLIITLTLELVVVHTGRAQGWW